MRILFISGELIAGDLPWRLQEEGCEVKLFVEDSRQADCQQGFVEHVDNWERELSWVGKDGLIVFDDVGYGKVQDDLRAKGYRVFGGSAGGDRLERDRQFAQDVLRSLGLHVEPVRNFTMPGDAVMYIREYPGRYVVKQNMHQSALNYVGVLDGGDDVISVLNEYANNGVRNVSLQRVIEGVEVSVARFFNGTHWVGPVEISLEHKYLADGDLGPQTGEMGTLTFYDKNINCNKLFVDVLAPLGEYLKKSDFRGDFAVNCIVNSVGAYPIDITARLGCPITHLQTSLHLSSWRDLLSAIADGQDYDLQCRDGFGVVMTLALPPFPYDARSVANAYLSSGLEVLFRQPLTAEERRRVHFEGVQRRVDDGRERFFVTKSIGYTVFTTGWGSDVATARAAARTLADKIVIPKLFYRTDIGRRFEEQDRDVLVNLGYVRS